VNTASDAHRWLIVDDDITFGETLARRLRGRGDEVLLAHDTTSALAHAEREPERVVVDLRIGDESGLRLLPQLRTRLPAARIIVLTGYASIATAVRATQAGADDYLPKPLLFHDLLAAFESSRVSDDAVEVTDEVMSARRLEWEHLQRVVVEENGNISQAARRLGMHRRTLQRKLAKRPVSR
jgi:two-component system, response regulator RegA